MKCVIGPKEKATTKMYHVACPMGRPTSKSECVEIQTSNDPYPGPVFFKKNICWAVGAGTIALDPTFGSFTLLEPVSH